MGAVDDQKLIQPHSIFVYMPASHHTDGRFVDGSCIRLRPERANHVWAYDFVEDRTHDGRRSPAQFLNGEIFYTLQEAKILIEA